MNKEISRDTRGSWLLAPEGNQGSYLPFLKLQACLPLVFASWPPHAKLFRKKVDSRAFVCPHFR